MKKYDPDQERVNEQQKLAQEFADIINETRIKMPEGVVRIIPINIKVTENELMNGFFCPANNCVCRCDPELNDYCHYSDDVANHQKEINELNVKTWLNYQEYKGCKIIPCSAFVNNGMSYSIYSGKVCIESAETIEDAKRRIDKLYEESEKNK